MQFIPVHTRILTPPQDDLLAVLDESCPSLQDGDVVLISSKVVAIHQGRCIPLAEGNKLDLVMNEADHIIPTSYRDMPLTIKYHTFLGNAGIDESNANEHYILLPVHITEFAQRVHTFLCQKYGVTSLGIIVTDSHSIPFRYGALGIALGFWGIRPLASHIGKHDLFGREIRYERSNIVDALAAAATIVSGEVAECQPIVVARDVPQLEFVDVDCSEELFSKFEHDRFRDLYINLIQTPRSDESGQPTDT